MIKSESDCLDCGLLCKYELCPHYRIKRLYCDKCKDEVDKFCINTAKKNYMRIV